MTSDSVLVVVVLVGGLEQFTADSGVERRLLTGLGD